MVGLVAAHEWAGAVHHVCHKVADVVVVRDQLLDEGYRPESGDEIKQTTDGKRVVFMRPADGNGPLLKLEEW